jgi:nucleotide-binding universal stress UspA family protein
MNESIRVSRMFHPTDFTRGDENAYAHALRIAFAAHASLSLLHVGSVNSDDHWDDFPGVRECLARWGLLPADAHRSDVARAGLKVEKVHRRGPDPLDSILTYLEEHTPDLVVLSTHQRTGLSRWLHGAKAEAISHASRALTLFVPRRVHGFVSTETGKARIQTVVIPIDHSPRPQAAVDAALWLATTLQTTETRFILLYVGVEEDFPEVRLPLKSGWTFEHQTWDGANVVDHVLASAEANDADLIVMATNGHHGFLDALRGSTTDQVLRGTMCPVLAVNAA